MIQNCCSLFLEIWGITFFSVCLNSESTKMWNIIMSIMMICSGTKWSNWQIRAETVYLVEPESEFFTTFQVYRLYTSEDIEYIMTNSYVEIFLIFLFHEEKLLLLQRNFPNWISPQLIEKRRLENHPSYSNLQYQTHRTGPITCWNGPNSAGVFIAYSIDIPPRCTRRYRYNKAKRHSQTDWIQ